MDHGKAANNYGIYDWDGYLYPQYGKEDMVELFFNLHIFGYAYVSTISM